MVPPWVVVSPLRIVLMIQSPGTNVLSAWDTFLLTGPNGPPGPPFPPGNRPGGPPFPPNGMNGGPPPFPNGAGGPPPQTFGPLPGAVPPAAEGIHPGVFHKSARLRRRFLTFRTLSAHVDALDRLRMLNGGR